MTNDFVALLKDSSLVSVITVVELTKQTQIFATNIGSWVIPGRAVRRPVPGHVAAAGASGAPARGAVEGGVRMTEPSTVPGLRPAVATASTVPRCSRCRACACRAASARYSAVSTLPVERGEIVALMGLSGSGKTTILRSVAGLERSMRARSSSTARRCPAGCRRGDIRRALHGKVGMVFQFHFLFEHLSAIDNVCLAPVHVHRVARAQAEARAQDAARSPRRRPSRHGVPRELSGGEAQRVGHRSRAGGRSAAAAARRADGLARSGTLPGARRRRCRRLASEGRTLVMTSHDDEFVEEFATRVVVLADGRVVEEGVRARCYRSTERSHTGASQVTGHEKKAPDRLEIAQPPRSRRCFKAANHRQTGYSISHDQHPDGVDRPAATVPSPAVA